MYLDPTMFEVIVRAGWGASALGIMSGCPQPLFAARHRLTDGTAMRDDADAGRRRTAPLAAHGWRQARAALIVTVGNGVRLILLTGVMMVVKTARS